MIKVVTLTNKTKAVQVDCDTCIAGWYLVHFDESEPVPSMDAIATAGGDQGWDVSNREKLRCPLCVADGTFA